MYVRDVRCISLGIVQKEAGEFQGKPTTGYTALNYVIVDEHESRRAYLNDSALIAAAFKYCGKWGAAFCISGALDARGKLTLDTIEAAEAADDFII